VSDPLVLAVVVNWNGEEVLGPCLETLLASTYPNLRVLVVDNDSTDASVALTKERFPSVRVVEMEKNEGYASGVNAGLEAAREEGAEYALLLNNDIELDAGAVGAMVRAASGRERVAFVGPLIYYHDRPDVVWSAGGAVSMWTGNIRHLGLRDRDKGQFTEVVSVDYVTGCAMLASMEAVESVGVMDEGYYMYNEDTDWCVRAREAGYEVLFAPEARIWHKVSMSSGGGLTSYKIYNRLRSTGRFFSLHARPYHWLGILPSTACRTLGFAARELSKGNGAHVSAIVRGALDTLTGRKRN